MKEVDEVKRVLVESEEQDPPRAILPPKDIVAYNEMRSCHDLLTMHKRGTLNINPDFQRHNVWQPKDQSLFIDSLLKNLPIPNLCIFHDAPRDQKIVVDGVQRICAILHFFDSESEWKVSDIEGVDERLRGKSVDELRTAKSNIPDIIEERVLPVTVIHGDYRKKSHQQYLIQIFSRLNSCGKRLFNQELRNCVYGGRFNDALKRVVRTKTWLTFAGLTEKQVDAGRFGQEERLLRIFAFYHHYKTYKGGLNSFLNDTMSDYQDVSSAEFSAFESILTRALTCYANVKRYEMSPKKNWNVCEAAVVGVMLNIKDQTLAPSQCIEACSERYYQKVNNESLREGVMQAKKVRDRITDAVISFKGA